MIKENTLQLIESYSDFVKSTITSASIGKMSNFFGKTVGSKRYKPVAN